jgi:aspartate-semialdehyde dehydrogenase
MAKAVGIVGATGAVGAELIQVLADLKFPVGSLHLFASERSAGKTVTTPFGEKTIETFSVEAAGRMDVVLLAVSGEFAKQYAPALAEKTLVIDNSSAFRLDDNVPLIIPEINGSEAARLHNGRGLVANPNCTTAIAAMALWPLHKAFGLKRVIVSSYQATSGAGIEGMNELLEETRNVLDGKEAGNKVFAHPIPFNVIPQIDVLTDNGYFKEEMKVTWETRKIFAAPDLLVSCTAVRVPTLRVHSEAITIETEKPVTPEAARAVLATMPGLDLVDDPANKLYPMPITATRKHNVEAGRVRQSLVFGDHGLDLFVAGDQILKGAALNAVQIAQLFA